MSQQRAEKISHLCDILNNNLDVSATDKELALQYFNCLAVLWSARVFAPWRLPLLEGLDALHKNGDIFARSSSWISSNFFMESRGKHIDQITVLGAFESALKNLPIRPETTPPQNGQSSLNASD
jgi:hypothetical protein